MHITQPTELVAIVCYVRVQASRPFLFLDLRMPPRHVDVNMHPTKREVGLLNQVRMCAFVTCSFADVRFVMSCFCRVRPNQVLCCWLCG